MRRARHEGVGGGGGGEEREREKKEIHFDFNDFGFIRTGVTNPRGRLQNKHLI